MLVLENGELKYFPAGNAEVSEIVTMNGRMVVLNMPTPSTSSDPPPYTAEMQKA